MVSPATFGRSTGHLVLLPKQLATAFELLRQAEKGAGTILLPTPGLASLHVKLYWCDVCQKSSLPVLCLVLSLPALPRLDHSIPSEDQTCHSLLLCGLLVHTARSCDMTIFTSMEKDEKK